MVLFKKSAYHFYRGITSLYSGALDRLKPAGLFILGFVFTCVIFGVTPGRTLNNMTYQVFTLVSALGVVSILSSLFFRGKFQVKRELGHFATAGEPLTYRIVIENQTDKVQSGLSFLENFSDHRPSWENFCSAGDHTGRGRSFFDQSLGLEQWLFHCRSNKIAKNREGFSESIRPGEKKELSMKLFPLRRGYLRFEGISIARPDPFGLSRGFIRIPAEHSLLVLPKTYPAPPVQLPGMRKYHQKGVTLASSIGESEEFVGLREYRPGDPIRDIHWASWAKTGKPIIKQYQEEYFSRHALVLDTFIKKRGSDLFEETVSVAASFISNIELGESLLDLMFVGTEAYCFTSGRSLGGSEQMLEILASVKESQTGKFKDLHDKVLERASLLSGCIGIFLAWDEPRKALVKSLRSLKLPLLAIVVVEPGKAQDIDPGPMKDDPGHFHVLEIGNIEEGIRKI